MADRVILYVGAHPDGTAKLRLDREFKAIDDAIRGRGHRLEPLWAASFNDLLQGMLNHQPAVVHFSGHGRPDALLFERASGAAHAVATEAIERLFSALPVELAVFNACDSRPIAEAVARFTMGAVGYDEPVRDTRACHFAAAFYAAWTTGRPGDVAAEVGRAVLTAEGTGDTSHVYWIPGGRGTQPIEISDDFGAPLPMPAAPGPLGKAIQLDRTRQWGELVATCEEEEGAIILFHGHTNQALYHFVDRMQRDLKRTAGAPRVVHVPYFADGHGPSPTAATWAQRLRPLLNRPGTLKESLHAESNETRLVVAFDAPLTADGLERAKLEKPAEWWADGVDLWSGGSRSLPTGGRMCRAPARTKGASSPPGPRPSRPLFRPVSPVGLDHQAQPRSSGRAGPGPPGPLVEVVHGQPDQGTGLFGFPTILLGSS